MKITKKKCYASCNRYTEYLGEYFWDDKTMKAFGTRNTYYEIVDGDGVVLGIEIYNSKAPRELKKVFYVFLTNDDGEKYTKKFYSYGETKEFIAGL